MNYQLKHSGETWMKITTTMMTIGRSNEQQKVDTPTEMNDDIDKEFLPPSQPLYRKILVLLLHNNDNEYVDDETLYQPKQTWSFGFGCFVFCIPQ
jgi:hypothetical protein